MADARHTLQVVPGETAAGILHSQLSQVLAVVEQAYVLHGTGDGVNPPGPVLRLPHRPDARLSALPAYVGGATPVSGVKWLASYPGNVEQGLARASAVVILNDEETGRPFACLEASHISAARTAASAVLAAQHLHGDRRSVERLAVCGTGLLARYVYRFLLADGWRPKTVAVFDTHHERARRFADEAAAAGDRSVDVCCTMAEAVQVADLVVFTTTASAPHVDSPELFAGAPLVLHISLRDLSPEVIVSSQNVVDDREHAFRDGTSLALTRAKYPLANFLIGSLFEVMSGTARVDPRRTRVFSPFGLGVLDVAVGRFVYERAVEAGLAQAVGGFFDRTPSAILGGAS